MSLYEKLNQIQGRLDAPKGQFNAFGKYAYRSCEDILGAVKPLLQELGLVLVLGDELMFIGQRYYVKAEARLVDQETAEHIENTAFAREEENKKGMDGSQITGAASSYARKYALNGLFAIDDNKDSDATNQGGDQSKPSGQAPKAKNVLPGQDGITAANFWQKAKELGYTEEEVKTLLPRAAEPLNDAVAVALMRQLRGLKHAK